MQTRDLRHDDLGSVFSPLFSTAAALSSPTSLCIYNYIICITVQTSTHFILFPVYVSPVAEGLLVVL